MSKLLSKFWKRLKLLLRKLKTQQRTKRRCWEPELQILRDTETKRKSMPITQSKIKDVSRPSLNRESILTVQSSAKILARHSLNSDSVPATQSKTVSRRSLNSEPILTVQSSAKEVARHSLNSETVPATQSKTVKDISRSSSNTVIKSISSEEALVSNNHRSYYDRYESLIGDGNNLGSGFQVDLEADYKPSLVVEQEVPISDSSCDKYYRSLSRSQSKKKPIGNGQTLVQELERKKSVKRAALEPIRNPNVSTLIDVTAPNLIRKGTLLDRAVSLSRSKSRSIGSIKILVEQSSDNLRRSHSKSRMSSSGLMDSSLPYSSPLSAGNHSAKSIDIIRAATYLNNTSDESEDRSFELQRKFLARTDGLSRRNTESCKNTGRPKDSSRSNSRRAVPADETLSRKKYVRGRAPLLDDNADSASGIYRSKSMRNGETLSRKNSRRNFGDRHSSSDDDNVPLGLAIRRAHRIE